MRSKNWPKQGQKFSKFKKFKIIQEDKKDYPKLSTFGFWKKKKPLLVYILSFFGLWGFHKPGLNWGKIWLNVHEMGLNLRLCKQFILEKWIYMALMRFNSNKTWLKGITVSKHAIPIPSVFFYMHFFASIYGQVC